MSRSIKRIVSIALVIMMLCTTGVFAAAAAIVSPASNTVTTSSSLLVSVKVTELKTIKVTVYEEKNGTDSVDVTNYTSQDLASIAEVYAGNSKTATLSDGTETGKFTSSVYSNPVDFTNTKEVGFYTKQYSSVKPGLYRVQVETLDTDGETVTETINSFVAVKQKVEETNTNLFETKQTGALKFLQSMLKSIFK